MKQRSILLLTSEIIARQMSGPGIRHWEMARTLAGAGFYCTLMSPRLDRPPEPGFTCRCGKSTDDIIRAISEHDIIIAGGDDFPQLSPAQRVGKHIIVDLITPRYFESLTNNPVRSDDKFARAKVYNQEIHHRQLLRKIRRQLQLADHILCGTERQRDMLIGMLASSGEILPHRYQHYSHWEDYLTIVPHGLSVREPQRGSGIRTTVPGINKQDTVVLWWGCSADWYDYQTIFTVFAELAETRQDIKLVLTAPRHPGCEAAAASEIDQWLTWARERGLLDTVIFVLPEWIPYDERDAVLMDADIGIYCHRQNLETHYSIRTRFYDYLWASLPMVMSAGDSFAPIVEREQLGRVIAAGDAAGWAVALRELADDPNAAAKFRENLRRCRERYRWPEALQGLLKYLQTTGLRPKPRRLTVNPVAYLSYLVTRAWENYNRYGLRVTGHKLLRHLGKLAGK